MGHLIRVPILPMALLLLGLTGCVVETPVQRDVVVERPAPPSTVYVAPATVVPE